jgi:putative DNA primase/helicase
MGAIDQFKRAIEATGLLAPPDIQPGRWIKFPGYQKNAKNRAAWCFMFEDMRGGVFGDYSTDMESTWQAGNATPYTDAERLANRQRIVAMNLQREADTLIRQQSAASNAAQRWTAATPCTSHVYLTAKGIQACGVKSEAGKLLIPMFDTAGKIHSIQSISTDGSKMFMAGGRVKGCYFAIGRLNGLLIVCEGFATGASLYACTGHAVAVAFNSGNLAVVAAALRAKYPTLAIVVAADDDHQTTGNPGMRKALDAALVSGAQLAVPDFKGVGV